MSSRNARFINLISGRSKGAGANVSRLSLSIASLLYRSVIGLRNQSFDRLAFRSKSVDCPVISVGNITVGGTGKTPMTVRLAELLASRGRKVGILSRGYKAATENHSPGRSTQKGDNDETLMLRRRCPSAVVVVDPNRVRGAHAAMSKGADVLLLDDGFQHRRLRRNLDIVLVDATLPFGYDALLPRGLLREPLSSLGRASLVVVTRSNEVLSADRKLLVSRLQSLSDGKPVITAIHRTPYFVDLHGDKVKVFPRDIQAVIFAGIANFESFRKAVESIGVKVLAAYEYPDHHDYTAEEIRGLQDVGVSLEANAILTTEKDAVKLAGRWENSECSLFVLRLEIEFDSANLKILDEAIDRVLSKRAEPEPAYAVTGSQA